MTVGSEAFEGIDGTVTLRQIGNQVFMDVEGDNWHCSVVLNKEAQEGISNWFTLLRLSQ